MKILHVNSFYYDRGGDCTHMFNTAKLLEKHGHQNIYFAMLHPLNFPSPFTEYWPSYIDYKEALKEKTVKIAIKVILRTVYSFEARRCIEVLLENEKPDIVHIQNIHHHITPSILGVIKKRRIPIVWTLHDYSIICPNNSFMDDNDGSICEACKSGRFYMAPLKRCKKNSFGASFMAMLENYIHRILDVYRHVDLFLSPSDFLKNKFIEHGMGEKVVTLNNFVNTDMTGPEYSHDNYAIYSGRITAQKGISTLIKAAVALPELKIKVVGSGELLSQLIRAAPGNIEFVGGMHKEEVQKLIARAMFAIVPSEGYENFPYSVLEPMVVGKPVIGTRIGGIPEIIEEGISGLLFTPGNACELREKMLYLAKNEEIRRKMGEAARKRIEEKFGETVHYQQLIRYYRELIDENMVA